MKMRRERVEEWWELRRWDEEGDGGAWISLLFVGGEVMAAE